MHASPQHVLRMFTKLPRRLPWRKLRLSSSTLFASFVGPSRFGADSRGLRQGWMAILGHLSLLGAFGTAWRVLLAQRSQRLQGAGRISVEMACKAVHLTPFKSGILSATAETEQGGDRSVDSRVYFSSFQCYFEKDFFLFFLLSFSANNTRSHRAR